MRDGDPGWSDERLAAAFRERSVGRDTPEHLEAATMARIKITQPERRSTRWLALAAPLAAAIAVAAIALMSVTSPRPPDSAETDAAPSVGRATAPVTAPPPSVPTPPVITLEFPSGPHRILVDVVDRSGRLLRAAKASPPVSPGRPSRSIRASAVAGHPDQVHVEWFGGACDPTTQLTIGADLTSIRVESTDSRGVDPGALCRVGGSPRGVILTFDGPVRVEDIAIVGESPGPILQAAEALGLPVITVEEALRHRNESLDDTELAVFGYWYQPPITTTCPLIREISPVRPVCNDRGIWLTASPMADTPQDRPVLPPTDAALQPLIRDAIRMEGGMPVTGQPVLVVGHFDDHRAAACEPSVADECRGSFIADVLLDPANPTLDLDRVETGGPILDVDPVANVRNVERAATEAPNEARQILAAFAVPGGDLARYEPQAAEIPDLADAAAVWIVRYRDASDDGRPIVRTRLVIDGPPPLGDGVYEATSSGVSAVD
jgi:hypothetical protein